MRAKAGIVCLIIGAALIFGALSLFLYNQQEAAQAEKAGEDLLPQLREAMETGEENTTQMQSPPPGIPMEYLDADDFVMTEVEIDGYGYIGYLSIPKLELELPIMGAWDYERLQIAPCRYTGSVRGEDLVLMAHNYASHFGNLSNLSEGDSIVFTDMDGIVTNYQVITQDILDPYAVEEMIAGEFDVTLFTCTYGGQSRVTIYCDRIS